MMLMRWIVTLCVLLLAALLIFAPRIMGCVGGIGGIAPSASSIPMVRELARASYGAGGKWVLVLDLDETLGHTLDTESMGMGMGAEAPFIERPHLHQFLAAVTSMFDEVVVFTAGTADYAAPILDRMDPTHRTFRRRFYRDSCTLVPSTGGSAPAFTFVKDLRILGEPDLSRVLILDNTPSAYALQPQCGVPIPSFFGDPADDALLHALRDLAARRRGLWATA
jgi:Dullard-like phosphatase family protein